MVLLIPAFEPDHRLLELLREVRRTDPHLAVVVVDDGSGPAYATVFADARALGAHVLKHGRNHGKGTALRTGLLYIHHSDPTADVVCADSDGQHLVPDILAVAAEVQQQCDALVLGARQFVGPVPWRSRVGNTATAWAVRLTSGLRLADTQTGLRGYPAALVPWLLTVPGDRFEYELSALLDAHARGIRIVELPIATVYHDGNAGTHFRPVADSARVYAPLLRFAASSLAAAAIDVVGLLALMAATGNLLVSVVGARLFSATVNFVVNRQLVFRQPPGHSLRGAAARYATLAAGLLAANYLLMWLLTGAGLALLLAKLLTETGLYLTSYVVQHRVVFRGGQALGAGAGSTPASAAREPASVRR